MWKVVQQDDAGKLEELLAKGGKAGEVNKKGETLLMACVEHGAHECLRLLLGKNVDLAATDKEGATVAIRAVKQGDTESLEALANKSSKALLLGDSDGLTPLHWAVKLNEMSALSLLLGLPEVRRELLSRADKQGYAPIHRGIQSGSSEETLSALLEADKEQLELPEKQHGRTPLLMAAAFANQEAFGLLLRAGGNLSAADKSLKNVLHLAAQSQEIPPTLGQKEQERLVMSADVEGNTPLHLAALGGDETLYNELKRAGGNELRVNAAGYSAATLLKNAIQNHAKEEQEAVEQLQREAAEKERARLESEAAKQRVGATIEAKFAEKNAAKYAKRRARAAEREAGEEGEDEEDEEKEEAPPVAAARATASVAATRGSDKAPAAARVTGAKQTAAVAKPTELRGWKSTVWMVSCIVLFLAIFVAAKLYGKSSRKP
jgi:ankyrin repeat protein